MTTPSSDASSRPEKDTVDGSQPFDGESTPGLGRVECGTSVQDWWCRLDPGHSGGCIPRRKTPDEVAAAALAAEGTARRERYAAAIRDRIKARTFPPGAGAAALFGATEFDLADAAMAVADAEQATLRRDRDLAVAHDRQPYPTAWAYEQACAALRRKTEAIERLRALAERWENALPPDHAYARSLRTALADTEGGT
ncbi:hypothetical protein ACFYRN_25025 [Streptomyces sp. NPDC005227]|uniref:hypothetical protein n=1 Tax=Streptomyces sp. NPDC005227 TaxID=3364707 RepID=UPI0036736AEC